MKNLPLDDLDPEAKSIAHSMMVIEAFLNEGEAEVIVNSKVLATIMTLGLIHVSACYKAKYGYAMPWDTKYSPEQARQAMDNFGVRPYKEQWS